jgi:hypothetical protein
MKARAGAATFFLARAIAGAIKIMRLSNTEVLPFIFKAENIVFN